MIVVTRTSIIMNNVMYFSESSYLPNKFFGDLVVARKPHLKQASTSYCY